MADWHCLLQGAGTRDGTLIRNIVSRSEIDLNLIKGQFQKMYGKTLSSMIMVRHRPLAPSPPAWDTNIPGTQGAMTEVIGEHPFQ